METRTLSTRRSLRRGSRGQSAVETMFMIPILMLVFVGMYELFTITYGSQKAHIRAREYALHGGAFTGAHPAGEPLDAVKSGGTHVFVGGNYIIADPGIWGVSSAISGGGSPNKGWKYAAHDRGIRGVVTSSADQGTYVKATAYICSPMGCP